VLKTKTEFTPFTAKLVGIASAFVVFIILVLVLRELAAILQPLFIAVFFYYIGAPLIRELTARKVPSFIAYLVPIFIAVAVLLILGWIIGAYIDDLAANFPSYKLRIQKLAQSSLGFVYVHIPVIGDELKEALSKQTIPLGHLEKIIGTIIGNFVGFLSTSLLVIFFLIFINSEASSLPKRLIDAYGAKKADNILGIGRRINKGIIEYVYVKGLASLLVALLSTGAMLAFRLDLAILWGTLTFFGNFVPYVGSAMAVLFPIVIALLQFNSAGSVFALAICLIGFQILVGNFLEPKYAGQQLNLSPLVVLVSLVFWGWLWGVVGLLLSIPIMVSVKFVLENFDGTRDIAIMMSHVSKKETK